MSPTPTASDWTATSVLETSYRLARDNFAAFFQTILIFSLPSLIASIVDLGVIGLIIEVLCGIAIWISLSCGTLQAMAGRKPDLQSMLRQLNRPNVGQVLALAVIQAFAIVITAVLVVPALFLLTLWAVTLPAMLVERTGIDVTFWRSVDLTRGRRWRVLGVFLLAFVICAICLGVIFLVLGILIEEGSLVDRLALWLAAGAISTVVYPLPAILYVLLRGEIEGVTVEQIATALD
jgi:hypothetical protein